MQQRALLVELLRVAHGFNGCIWLVAWYSAYGIRSFFSSCVFAAAAADVACFPAHHCLQDLSWSQLKISSKAQPNARSGHVATLANDAMLVFGGAPAAAGSAFVVLTCLHITGLMQAQ